MSFIIPELKIAFLKRFPDLIKVKNWWKALKNIKGKHGQYETDKLILKQALGNNIYKNCITLFSVAMEFHNHIFSATEKYRTNLYAFSINSKRFQKMY